MREEYGIELELVTKNFENKILQIQHSFDILSRSAKDKVSLNVGDESINQTKKNIQELAKTIEETQAILQYASSNQGQTLFDTRTIKEAQRDLTKATERMRQYGNEIKKAGKYAEDTGKKGKAMLLKFDTNKLVSKVRRFGLALLSVRSIYSLVSRASQAYLSDNEDVANKMKAIWSGLGSMLAPIIEKIVNYLIVGVQYLNAFVKGLFGVDLLAQGMAKSVNKANSSVKSLNKSLAGFDEITNIGSTSDNSGAIDTSWVDAFNQSEPNLDWLEKIEKFGEWVKENKAMILGFILGVSAGITAINLGFGVLDALGVALIIGGITTAIIGLKSYLDDPTFTNLGTFIEGIGIALAGLAIIVGGLPLAIAAAIVLVVGLGMKFYNQIVDFFNNIDLKLSKLEGRFGIVGDYIIAILRFVIQNGRQMFESLYTGIKQIIDGIIMLFKGDFKNGIISILKGTLNLAIGLINTMINGLNLLIWPIRKIITTIGKALGKNLSMDDIKIPNIPKLNVGTNYVPEDQLAYIHKGEAVVPKKFNSKEYFGTGNEETNSLLRELITTLDNKDMNAYISSRDIGQASTNYINRQNRIMGRSVV